LPALHAIQRIARPDVPLFLSREWPELVRNGARALNFKLEDFVVEPQVPTLSLRLTGGLARLEAQVSATYGVRVLPLGQQDRELDAWIPDPNHLQRYWTRNLAAEKEALSRLIRCGFALMEETGKLQLVGQNAVMSFFAREYPKLQREWQVSME